MNSFKKIQICILFWVRAGEGGARFSDFFYKESRPKI